MDIMIVELFKSYGLAGGAAALSCVSLYWVHLVDKKIDKLEAKVDMGFTMINARLSDLVTIMTNRS